MDLMTFNVFGEARVKADTVILTATGVKSLAGTVFNEVEIVDLENELPIEPDDPVRYLFVTNLEGSDRHKTFKRQVAGPTLTADDQGEVDQAIRKILETLMQNILQHS